MLISKKEQTSFDEEKMSIRITEDFYFDVIGTELVGWKLKNVSMHIVSNEKNYINNNIQNKEMDKVILTKYIELINKLDTDMIIAEEQQLRDELKKLHKCLEKQNSCASEAIKENILNVLEFM